MSLSPLESCFSNGAGVNTIEEAVDSLVPKCNHGVEASRTGFLSILVFEPRDNDPMAENTITVPPQLEPEIAAGLAVMKKKGYRVTAEEPGSGELLLHFKFGEYEQTLKFSNGEWENPGTVEKRIVEKLDI
jgi:hypothetical protein